MVTATIPTQIDRLEPAGPARTTGAGRVALPVALIRADTRIGVLELVLDEAQATAWHAALAEHLAGRGAQAPTGARTRADLL